MHIESDNYLRSLTQVLQNHPEIEKTISGKYTIKRSPYNVILPTNLTIDLYRIVGIIHGDGNMSGRRILISDKNLSYHENVVIPLFERTFGITLNLYYDRNRHTYYAHSKCKILYLFLVEIFNIPQGPVRSHITIPELFAFAPSKLHANYIAGLYDSESHIRKNQAEIDFYSTSLVLINFIKQYLMNTQIEYSLMKRNRGNLTEYELIITGKRNVTKFSKYIPMLHPAKINVLQKHIQAN